MRNIRIANLIAGALAVIVLFAAPAPAQQLPPGKWWHNERVSRALDLSAEQRGRLDVVFRDAAPQLIDLKAEVEKASVALRGTLDQAVLDRQAVQEAAAAVSRARALLFERELMMLVDMRGVLNQEQWNRFRSLIEQRPRNRARQEEGPPRHPPRRH
ncbi:MAG: periplasmic heavy metal sensor [Thermoanaerobaculia bacterium]